MNQKIYAIYLKSDIQHFFIRLYFACHIPHFKTLVIDADSAFFERSGSRKIDGFIISRFVIYRSYGNIDFLK